MPATYPTLLHKLIKLTKTDRLKSMDKSKFFVCLFVFLNKMKLYMINFYLFIYSLQRNKWQHAGFYWTI